MERDGPQWKCVCECAGVKPAAGLLNAPPLPLSLTMTGRWGGERAHTLPQLQVHNCSGVCYSNAIRETACWTCAARKKKVVRVRWRLGCSNKPWNWFALWRKRTCSGTTHFQPFRQCERERPEGIFKQPCGSTMLLSVGSETETLPGCSIVLTYLWLVIALN